MIYYIPQVPDGLYEALEDHMKSFGMPNKSEAIVSSHARLCNGCVNIGFLCWQLKRLYCQTSVICAYKHDLIVLCVGFLYRQSQRGLKLVTSFTFILRETWNCQFWLCHLLVRCFCAQCLKECFSTMQYSLMWMGQKEQLGMRYNAGIVLGVYYWLTSIPT